MAALQTFRLAPPSEDVEGACRRALRNVDWQELPTDTFKIDVPAPGQGHVFGELLIGLIELLPLSRRLFSRLRTVTRHAPPASARSQAVIYAVWGRVVMVTISLRMLGNVGTELTIAGQGGLPGKAAAAVQELRHSIEVQSGSLTTSPRP